MIGILNAYHFDSHSGTYQEEYTSLIQDFARKAFPDKSIQNYKIAQGHWPQGVDDCQVWMITGSAKGAYDPDPWIGQLKDFVRAIHQSQKKLIGICFGHQIIAEALGGEVIKSPKGWGVGVRNFKVVSPRPWMNPPLKEVSLLFSHQDQVTKLPPGAELLAEDPFCEFQMFQIGDNILTMQGHPEFSVSFAESRLKSRQDKIPAEVFQKAMASYQQSRDDDTLAQWIRNFSLRY